MNRNLYRVVFNVLRGARMVVQETAKSAGKATGSTPSRSTSNRGPVSVSLAFMAALTALSAAAQIVADPSAPGNQRPPVLAAPNGVPVVVIATPSAAGVSRNTYRQFDVGSNGVILNNSRTAVQSQLGGFISANPYLATGSARVILNEVNSSNPSYLNGPVEIAGPRAEFILANPSGIQVNGTTFINASGVTLTTGTPQFGASGNLERYLVRGGTVTIGGTGMDASSTDFTAILARAVQINAGLWAKDLKIVTGVNDISADASQVTQITPTAGTGATPRFALDVAAVGGMYAGHIFLVGTEAGLGMRNAGTIQTSAGPALLTGEPGKLTLSHAGLLENSGLIQIASNADITAASFANSGTVQSATALQIATQGDLSNRIGSAGGTLEAQRVDLASAAGDIHNEGGTIRQTGTAALTVSSPSLSNTNGGFIGAEPVAVSSGGSGSGAGGTGTSSGSGTTTGSTGSTGVASGGTTGGSTSTGGTTASPVVSPGALTASAGSILNDGGKVYAGGPITLQTPHVNNAGGTLNVASMALSGPSFSNAGGTLNVSGAFTANIATLDNAGGHLQAGTIAITTTGDLDNTGGTLASEGDVTLGIGGSLENTNGTVSAIGALNTTVAGAIDNTAGRLLANGALRVHTGALVNTGTVRAGGDSTLTATGMLSNAGQITSGGNTVIAAATLDSSASGVLGAGIRSDGKVGSAGGDLRVTAAGSLAAHGTQLAAGDIALQGASTDLTGSTISAANIGLTATAGDVTTSHASIVTPGTLAVQANTAAGQSLVNDTGTLSAGQLDLHASNIQNTHAGQIVQTGAGATTIAVTGTLDNTAGRIASNAQDLTLAATTLQNTGGAIQHAGAGTTHITATSSLANDGGTIASNGNLSIAAATLDNQHGTLRSTGTASLDITTSGLLDNGHSGVIGAGGDLAVHAGQLSNDAGSLTAVGSLGVSVSGAASNVGGTLAANGNTTLTAASLDNTRGTVAAVTGDLAVTTTGTTVNAAGALQAAGRTSLVNAGLVNTQGKVTGNALSVDTNGNALDNTLGTLAAKTTVDLQSGALTNDQGLIQSGGAMSVDTHAQALANTKAAGHSSGQGGIASGGTLTLDTGAIDNTAGFIGAKDTLTATTDGFTNAAGGVVLGQADVAIATNSSTSGATYDNRGGKTLAVGDLTLDAGSATVRNSGALIRSGGTTRVLAGTVENASTLGTDQGIEGENVAIAASTVNNNAGAIRSDANVTITSAGLLDNASGLISARDTLAILDPNAAQPSAKTLGVLNAGGTLVADKRLQLDAASLSGAGKLTSLGDLSVHLSQDVVNDGEVSADGNLSYATTGGLTNNGKLLAGNVLTVSGRDVENTATGEMRGDTTIVNASGTLTNRGLIDGSDTQINAATVTNVGTGRIYGDHLSIAAHTVNNLAETIDGVTRAATIAARERLDIGASTLVNQDGALIFSSGDMAIGGSLDASRRAVGQAGTLTNKAATIQALGSVDIDAATLDNLNGGVTWAPGAGSTTQHVVQYKIPTTGEVVDAANAFFSMGNETNGWKSWNAIPATSPYVPGDNGYFKLLVASPQYPVARYGAYYLHSPANSVDISTVLCSGEPEVCGTLQSPGSWYGVTDPIWSTFDVAPPAADLSASHPGRKDPDITVGQIGITVMVEQEAGYLETIIPFAHPVTQAEYDEWQAYRQAHQALDAATSKFIASVLGSGSNLPRLYAIYDALDYTQTSPAAVMTSSAPGQILAGGAMNIHVGQGTNDASQIIAGGALTVTGGIIANVGTTVDTTVTQSGSTVHSYVKSHSFSSDERVYESAPYNLSIPGTTTLGIGVQAAYQATGSGTAIGAVSTGQASGSAQAAGAVTATTRVSPIVEVPSSVGDPASATGSHVAQVASAPSAGGAGAVGTRVVRTATPNATVPVASVFRALPGSTSQYLVETDPAFANYRNWLSSDYLLNNLGLDPNTTLKRLGDGFYEQQLITQQIAQLTGSRYLEGFGNDETQYLALMNAGVTFAEQYGLTPGIALSAAQMAQLTSDIVWLVRQSVTLPDGSTQDVLVPQVYVRVRPGDIDGAGALLSGDSVNMNLSGDLNNQGGTIAGRSVVSITAQNINELGGRITGQDVTAFARNDLNVIGGVIDAQNSLSAVAGGNVNVITTTRSASSDTGTLDGTGGAGRVQRSATVIDRVAGLYVSGVSGGANDGKLTVIAGGNITLAGANVASSGSTTLAAGGDVNLASVVTGASDDIRWSSRNSRADLHTQHNGSTVSGGTDVTIRAGGDITGTAATLSAGSALDIEAKGRVILDAGENQDASQTQHSQRSGMSRFGMDTSHSDSTLARTTLEAETVRIQSGGDMTLSAVDVNADALDIQAGGQLTLATQSTTSASSLAESDNDAAFTGAANVGHVDQTTQYTRLNVGSASIQADGGVVAQMAAGADLAALAQQPGMSWVNQLRNDPALANSTTWQQVEEAHQKWSEHQNGLGPVSSALVMLVVGVATAGAGTAAAGTAGTAATTTTAATAATGLAGTLGLTAAQTAILAGALQAGITTLVGQATVSLYNNGGDLAKVFDELGSSDSVKSLLTAMVTGGVLARLDLNPTGQATAHAGQQKFIDQLTQNVKAGAATALIKTAINGGSLADNLSDSLKSAFLNTVAAQTAHEIGDLELDAFINKVAHAMAGCAVGAANAGNAAGCAAGAIGAAIGEMTAEAIGRRDDTVAVASLMAGIAAAMAGGDAAQVNLAAAAGGNAAANNYLSHSPFANVKTLVAKENARLTAACEPNCTAEDFRRIDAQVQRLEAAAQYLETQKRSQLTTEQAVALGENIAALLPVYGTPIALYQALSGESLSGKDLSAVERFFNAVAAALPLGSAAYRIIVSSVADLRIASNVGANGGGKVAGTNAGFDTANLQSKLEGYLLDPAHPQNQTKATWFQQALGFDKSNWQQLGSQITFNESTAIATKTTQYGQTFEQVIPITGANGKTIDVPFVFMKDNTGTVRLVTGIPAKK